MSSEQKKKLNSAIWLEFLGSMYLAITLLVIVGIASIIGTVLQQNRPYNDYIIKFGEFWHEIFLRLGLYDIYGSLWFLVILTFLVISTTTCIWRNAPHMITEMKRFGLNVQKKSLQAFHVKREWQVEQPLANIQQTASKLLAVHGYQVRQQDHEDHTVMAAKKGSINRAGYIITHISMVIILLAAFIDGTFDLKFKEMFGLIKIETNGNKLISELSDKSFLPVSNNSFRSATMIPEGERAQFTRINVRDGYLIQELPFAIELKDFRISHYNTGQPKSYESDLVIHDPALEKPIEQTISVNHPLSYRGYTIYQADFGDGGSKLSLKVLPLTKDAPFIINSAVFQATQLQTSKGLLTLEFDNFRLYNIENMKAADVKQDNFTNVGPSVNFKVRDEQGQAIEYHNYMNPVVVEGRLYFISGVRASLNEPMRYLHIPYDPKGSLDRFVKFRQALMDTERLQYHAENFVRQNLASEPADKRAEIVSNMVNLATQFNQSGYEALMTAAQNAGDSEGAMRAYVNLLFYMQREVYKDVLQQEGIDVSEGVGNEDISYFNAAQEALAMLPVYGTPFFIQLASFEQIEASGLQITKSPAKNIVYLGCVLLIIGVFIMFYIPHNRVWLWLENQQGKVSIIMAGSTNRDRREFEQQFNKISEQLDASL